MIAGSGSVITAVMSLPQLLTFSSPPMAWSRFNFIKMLQDAIEDDRNGRFANTVEAFRSHGDIVLGDDGTFETLCNNDNYVIFIHQLLDCWVDSISQPAAYPYIQTTEWAGFAESLLGDIECGRTPSHSQWNNVYTLQCDDCHQPTRLDGGHFRCEQCERIVEFRSPSIKPPAKRDITKP